jgi:DNA invertase Pin-like site-specific DNA recombinase
VLEHYSSNTYDGGMSKGLGSRQRESGSAAWRPHLDACLDHLREGDVLTVWKLDRLGRNTPP